MKEAPQRAPTPPAKRNPLEVRKEKDVIRIEDVDPQKAEVHPETGLPIIRNGDQIVVLPPHKNLREILNVHPEAVAPSAISFVEALIGTGGIKDPGQILEGIQQMLIVLREYRRELQKGNDIDEAGRKMVRRIRSLRQTARKAHIREALFRAELFIVKLNMEARSILGYNRDHAIMDIAASEVQLAEAKKLVEDVLRNPEKYGLNSGKENVAMGIRKVLNERFEGSKPRVVGFTHVKNG